MTVDGIKAVLVGGPGSGKTSYLGALWSTIQNAGQKQTPRLDGNTPIRTAFLNAAEHALLGGRSVERTKRDTGERVELNVVLNGGPASLRYTDLAGETLNSVLLERKAPVDLIEDLQGSNALMLFIHPNAISFSLTIADGARLERALGEEVANNPLVESGDGVLAADSRIWAEAPTAIQLVELLQVCTELADRDGPVMPIAVMVSAWDLVEPGEDWGRVRPTDWLQTQLPMLAQFLRSNEAKYPWRVFGVSAQGFDFGDVPDDAEVWELPCRERTAVVTDDDWSRDISLPIEWLVKAIGESRERRT